MNRAAGIRRLRNAVRQRRLLAVSIVKTVGIDGLQNSVQNMDSRAWWSVMTKFARKNDGFVPRKGPV